MAIPQIRPVQTPGRPTTHALRFYSRKDVITAQDLLEEVTRGNVVFDLATMPTSKDPVLVFQDDAYDVLVAELKRNEIQYQELAVQPMSSLPPEEQLRHRGWGRA